MLYRNETAFVGLEICCDSAVCKEHKLCSDTLPTVHVLFTPPLKASKHLLAYFDALLVPDCHADHHGKHLWWLWPSVCVRVCVKGVLANPHCFPDVIVVTAVSAHPL